MTSETIVRKLELLRDFGAVNVIFNKDSDKGLKLTKFSYNYLSNPEECLNVLADIVQAGVELGFVSVEMIQDTRLDGVDVYTFKSLDEIKDFLTTIPDDIDWFYEFSEEVNKIDFFAYWMEATHCFQIDIYFEEQ